MRTAALEKLMTSLSQVSLLQVVDEIRGLRDMLREVESVLPPGPGHPAAKIRALKADNERMRRWLEHMGIDTSAPSFMLRAIESALGNEEPPP